MVTRQLPSSQLSCLVLDDDDYSSGGSSGSESETSVGINDNEGSFESLKDGPRLGNDEGTSDGSDDGSRLG